MEWQKKQEQLKNGHVPKEYKPFLEKGKKEFTSKASFIKDTGLKREYENRAYISNAAYKYSTKEERLHYQADMNLGDSI